MTRTSDEPVDSRALVSLSELGRSCVGRPTKAELDQGLNAVQARLAAGRVRERVLGRWSMVGVAALVLILAVLQVGSFFRQSTVTVPTLAYQIEGGSVLEGGYLRETGPSGIRLVFNEGSRFVLMPGTRGRLRAVDSDGARLAIEAGTASFEVVPSAHRRWQVEVGPFLVAVKGTVFSVSWDPTSERFELKLREGRVVVSGPVSGGDLTLRGGQRLLVSLPKAETLITEDQSEQSLSSSVDASAPTGVIPVASAPALGGGAPTGSNSSTGSTPLAAAKADTVRRWADELASGNWDRILESVEHTGVDAALNGASSEDLFALADAARYRRRTDLARAALLAQRRRFPDSPRALDATFLLGRVEESGAGGVARAIGWYDEYLAKAPNGAYAAEALGRKMTIASKVGGQAQARAIAEEYLRRFPKGSYAGTARALLRIP